MTQDTPIIDIQDVTIELGGKVILKDVNLKVFEHDSVVIIGPSGEGKSVLVKTIAGIYTPTKGRILIEGRAWKELTAEERRAQFKKIGMLFQKSALFDSYTCVDNVGFPMVEHDKTPANIRIPKCQNLLDEVGLDKAYDKFPHELSGGMQRRLGIARALALDPSILFYDDPTAGLDPVISDKIVKLILKLKAEHNSTVISVTNDIVSAFEIADRVIMVADQEVFETGSPDETQDSPDPRVQQFIHGELEGPLKPMTL